MRTFNPLSVLFLAAATIHFSQQPVLGIEPAPVLPQPDWVIMADQRKSDERLAGYSTPKQIKLEIVAEGPLFTRAGGMCFGTDGSLFVLYQHPDAEAKAKELIETITYRDGTRHAFTRKSTPARDAIKWVPDFGSKAAFERAKVILEEECLACAALHGGWLYTAGSGSVRRYRLGKNDGVLESKEIIARGFDGVGLRPAIGLSFDFDGALLIAVGAGNHDVEGSDGSRVRATGTGAIFRCRSNGSRMELLAVGLRHPSGAVAFDADFRPFLLDGDDDRIDSRRRLFHVAEASDFGFRSAPGSHPAAEFRARTDCLRRLPGVMEPIYSAARGTPAGICIYNEDRFPPFFQGLLLCPDPSRHCLRALRAERRDSSFAVTEEFALVRSADPQFTPAQVLPGPDGAIYFRDRLTSGGPRSDLSEPKREGRLYRLSWSGGAAHPALPLRSPSSWSRFTSQGGAELVKSLGAAGFSDRCLAQQELIRRGTLNKPALLTAVSSVDVNADTRLLAAGAISSWWDDAVKSALIKLATDDDAGLRRIAVECLGRNSPRQDPQVQEVLLYVLGDPDPVTRRSVALAMARVAAREAADCLSTALTFDIGGDPYLRDGFVRALELLGKPGLERLLALANSGEEDRLELAVEGFSAVRSPQGIVLLAQLLGHPHLRADQRLRLVRSLARYRIGRPSELLSVTRLFLERPPREPEVWLALAKVLAVQWLKDPGGFVQLSFSLLPE